MGKTKINEKDLEELNKKYQLLLLFNAQITRICMQHTGLLSAVDQKDLGAVQVVDMFLKFNIHAFTAYFDKYYIGKYTMNLKKSEVFLAGWNKHMEEFLNPIYLQSLKELKEAIMGNNKTQSYIT